MIALSLTLMNMKASDRLGEMKKVDYNIFLNLRCLLHLKYKYGVS